LLIQEYYSSKFNGRKLTFLAHFGNAEMKVYLNSKQYWIQCSTHIMCILMLYNNTDQLTFDDIMAITNIHKRHLMAALHSLTENKNNKGYPLLKKVPADNEIKGDDVFQINDQFKCKQKRFKIRTHNPNRQKIQQKLAKESEDQVIIVHNSMKLTIKFRLGNKESYAAMHV
jgi:hypothetical protein